MQTSKLSAYHTGEPQRSSIKSYPVLTGMENCLDMQNNLYGFLDNTKKVSCLTGSARCTLVTFLAATTINYDANNDKNISNKIITSTMSRIGLRKSTI